MVNIEKIDSTKIGGNYGNYKEEKEREEKQTLLVNRPGNSGTSKEDTDCVIGLTKACLVCNIDGVNTNNKVGLVGTLPYHFQDF